MTSTFQPNLAMAKFLSFTELLDGSDKDAVTHVFISDLHLSPDEPALTQAFLVLLGDLLSLSNLQVLYILGDWFEAWLGDDMADIPHIWLDSMIDSLRCLADRGVCIRVLRGNRDFLLGRAFCNRFKAELISEPFYFDYHNSRYRLEHGDSLCTDDLAYQRFRRIIQNPITKKVLLALPFGRRIAIADKLRNKSKHDNAYKAMSTMNTNALAVADALRDADILVHGHTHCPAEHNDVSTEKKRMVLGDWRINKNRHQVSGQACVSAVIGVILDGRLQLVDFDAMV